MCGGGGGGGGGISCDGSINIILVPPVSGVRSRLSCVVTDPFSCSHCHFDLLSVMSATKLIHKKS